MIATETRLDLLGRTARICRWLSSLVACASLVAGALIASSTESSCSDLGGGPQRCTGIQHPHLGAALLIVIAGLMIAAMLGAGAKRARGERLEVWWPGWLGGSTMVVSVYGLLAFAATLSSRSDGEVHLGSVTMNVSVAVCVAASVLLLALVAPFGGYRRIDALRSLVPIVGLVWMLPVVWESGVGLARLGNWDGISQDDSVTIDVL